MTKSRLFFLIILSISANIISGCMTTPTLQPEWKLEKEGIVLNLKTEAGLNEYEGKAHALYLVVYQLSSPNSFNQLRQTPEGLAGLLESRIFDPSVTSVKSLVVYPDSDTTHRIDRAEGTMYLGIVAGYSPMTGEGISRIYEIPVILKGKKLFINPGIPSPGILEIHLRLGARQIEAPPESDEPKGI